MISYDLPRCSKQSTTSDIAYEVTDIDASAAAMRAAGARFCGPDFREEFFEPVELSGVLHLWTIPKTTHGQSIQLLQRPHPAG